MSIQGVINSEENGIASRSNTLKGAKANELK